MKLPKSAVLVLRTIIYYDIFHYPLTEKDLIKNCHLSEKEFSLCISALEFLIQKGIIYKMGDYYSLSNNNDEILRRKTGNEEAKKWIKKAHFFSRLISWFPFVRGVSLSGSLSKGFVDDDPDIDYFIITKPNRLWITRSLLTAFKIIFLLNSYKYFCLNYFVALNTMEIEEKNLFTATEIITMIPEYGIASKQHFYEENNWVKAFYPNFQFENVSNNQVEKVNIIKGFFELFFYGKLGDMIDDWFMKINIKFRKLKFGKQFNEADFMQAFKSTKNISKHHPENFQKKVMSKFQSKVKEIEQEFDIELDTIIIELNS